MSLVVSCEGMPNHKDKALPSDVSKRRSTNRLAFEVYTISFMGKISIYGMSFLPHIDAMKLSSDLCFECQTTP